MGGYKEYKSKSIKVYQKENKISSEQSQEITPIYFSSLGTSKFLFPVSFAQFTPQLRPLIYR